MTDVVETGLGNAAMAGVLAILAACLCRLYRRPAFAHGLWLVVLIKLLTPPLLPIPLPWFGNHADVVSAEAAALPVRGLVLEHEVPNDANGFAEITPLVLHVEDNAHAAQQGEAAGGIIPAAWIGPIAAVWLTGSLLWLSYILLSTWRFRRLLRFAVEAAPQIQDQANELAGKLGLTRAPPVWLIPGVVSPMLWAPFRRARLLFPAQLIDRLDSEKLRTLLVHELAHWRRRDHWVRFLELAVQIAYWWHPAMWWARSELHDAEEQCCDAWVLKTLQGADHAYALALLETVAFISHTRLRLPATASGIGQVSHLRRRLIMIMCGNTSKSLTWAGGILLAGFGLALLPLAPARAQESVRGIQVVPAGDIQIQVVPAQQKKDTIDQQIAELRRLLQLLEAHRKLEAQGQGQAKPATPAANPEQIKRARSEVKELADIVAVKKAELQKAEQAFQKARAKLAALEGHSAVFQLHFGGSQPGLKLKMEGLNIPAQPNADKVLRGVLKLDGITIMPENASKERRTTTRPATPDLNQRLERVLREVEELRREIRQKK